MFSHAKILCQRKDNCLFMDMLYSFHLYRVGNIDGNKCPAEIAGGLWFSQPYNLLLIETLEKNVEITFSTENT